MNNIDYLAAMSDKIEKSFHEEPNLSWSERVKRASDQIKAEEEKTK